MSLGLAFGVAIVSFVVQRDNIDDDGVDAVALMRRMDG